MSLHIHCDRCGMADPTEKREFPEGWAYGAYGVYATTSSASPLVLPNESHYCPKCTQDIRRFAGALPT